jgi:hypothetical protein
MWPVLSWLLIEGRTAAYLTNETVSTRRANIVHDCTLLGGTGFRLDRRIHDAATIRV